MANSAAIVGQDIVCLRGHVYCKAYGITLVYKTEKRRRVRKEEDKRKNIHSDELNRKLREWSCDNI